MYEYALIGEALLILPNVIGFVDGKPKVEVSFAEASAAREMPVSDTAADKMVLNGVWSFMSITEASSPISELLLILATLNMTSSVRSISVTLMEV